MGPGAPFPLSLEKGLGTSDPKPRHSLGGTAKGKEGGGVWGPRHVGGLEVKAWELRGRASLLSAAPLRLDLLFGRGREFDPILCARRALGRAATRRGPCAPPPLPERYPRGRQGAGTLPLENAR